jgi:transcription-repair coupling factor (superfamily II helicase)
VGVSFYLKLLEQKIEELQSGKKESKVDTTIDLPISAYIPDEAFSSDIEKIHFYRELESVRSEEELAEVIEPLKTRIDIKQSACRSSLSPYPCATSSLVTRCSSCLYAAREIYARMGRGR